MKLAAWCVCWPLMGVLWACATVGDSMGAACEALDIAVDNLLDYAYSE